MSNSKILMLALAGTALATAPAWGGGLLGRNSGSCLCQTINGASGSMSTAGRRDPIMISQRQGGQSGSMTRIGSTARRSGPGTALDVNVARSIDPIGSIGMRKGQSAGKIGLAGTVSNAVSSSVGGLGASYHGKPPLHTTGNGKLIPGKALGHSNNHTLAGQVTRVANVSVLNKTGANGRSLANFALLNGPGGTAGKALNVSVANKRGTKGRSAVNVAALNGSGGTAGKVANVSVLNKTGTTGRSLANVAVLNGSGGTAGKVANVSVLNRTGTTGRSLVNASALNGSAGGTGRLANVSMLNGRHGKGHGGLGIPNGVQIINGVPCGPDGKPLTGAAAATVMAMIGGNGGNGNNGGGSDGGKGSGGGSSGGSSTGSGGGQAGSGSGGSTPPAAPSKPTGKASPGTYPFEDRINRDKY